MTTPDPTVPRWTPETESLVAAVWNDHDATSDRHENGRYDWICSCGDRTDGGQFNEHVHALDAGLRHADRKLLERLADAGLLVTPEMTAVLEAARRTAAEAHRWEVDDSFLADLCDAVDALAARPRSDTTGDAR